MARKLKLDFSWFFEWRTPVEFQDQCAAMNADLDANPEHCEAANLIEPGLQELLDAQTAAEFGLAYERITPGVKVRLCDPPQPDFQMRAGDQLMWFETTEADRKNRKRGDEFRQRCKVPPELRIGKYVDHEAAHEEFPKILRARVADKADKVRNGKYRSESGDVVAPNLVVRNNFSHRHSEVDCAQFVSDWSEVFPSIWLLETNGRIVQLA